MNKNTLIKSLIPILVIIIGAITGAPELAAVFGQLGETICGCPGSVSGASGAGGVAGSAP